MKNLYELYKHYMVWVGLILILYIPIVYKEIIIDGSFAKFLSSLLYGLPLLFLVVSVRKRSFFFILITIASVMSFIETMMVLLYQGYITSGNILSVLNTTSNESAGFLIGALPKALLALPVIIGCVMAVYFFKPKKIKPRLTLGFAALFVFLSCLFLEYQLMVKWRGNITTRFYVEQNVLSRYPYNFVFQCCNACEQMSQRMYIKNAENMSFGASRPIHEGKEIYVLAIGESLRYDNLSLGGYKRSTTPLLESLDNITLYSNYYSTANLTMYSVPQILTRATPDDFVRNYMEKSIYKPFKECGFKTFTICAGNLLTYETYLSDGCDNLICLPELKDELIADKVDSLSLLYDKTFFIIQFFGNHSPYRNFRLNQDKYHPNPVSDNVGWDNHEASVNAYDNTILFTDYNVHNIIKAIDKPETQSAFMMVSDHGADYDTGVSDHGGNCNPRKAEYHVPLIFWYSVSWGEKHKQKLETFISHKDLPVNSDNVFYSVCDMADITIDKKYAKPEWSLFSKKLQMHERRLLVPDGENTIKVK